MNKLLIALAALVAVSCSSSPDAPSNPLTGTWLGTSTATGSPAGTGTLRVTIRQDGGILAGEWSAQYADFRYSGVGTLSGGITGNAVQIVLYPGAVSATGCPYQVNATVDRGSVVMGGSFVTFSCPVVQAGVFSLQKQ